MPMIKGCDFPDLVDGDFVDVWNIFWDDLLKCQYEVFAQSHCY